MGAPLRVSRVARPFYYKRPCSLRGGWLRQTIDRDSTMARLISMIYDGTSAYQIAAVIHRLHRSPLQQNVTQLVSIDE